MKQLTIERCVWIVVIVSMFFWFAGSKANRLNGSNGLNLEPVKYTQSRDSVRLSWGPFEITEEY